MSTQTMAKHGDALAGERRNHLAEVEDEVINTVGFTVIAAPMTPQFGQQHMKVPA